MTRTFILAALLLVSLVGASAFALGQATVSTEVRINARQLEDGRVEFALEHEGERILPSQRYFPANAAVARWLRSSPIEIEIAGAPVDEPQAAASTSGTGEGYVRLGALAAGHYICEASVENNTASHGAGHFAIVSHGADGDYGALHANEGASTFSNTSRLVIGDGYPADLAPGVVWLEVSATQNGRWSFSCAIAR